MKEKNFISLVACVRNSENQIIDFLKKIDDFLFLNFDNFEIILVNNFSTDNTLNEIKKINKELHSNIVVINLSWVHELELAMLAGSQMAVGDYVYEFDAPIIDFEPLLMKSVYNKSMSGCDVVGAVPRNKIAFFSKLFYRFLNKCSYLNLDLNTERFHIISRRALNKAFDLKEKFRYRKALYKYSGYFYAYLEYDANVNVKINKKSFGERLFQATMIIFSFSDTSLKISMFFSLFFLLISILIGVYSLFVYFYFDHVIQGWTTIMLFLSFSFSGVFLVLVILGKYLSMILGYLQNRPDYFVSSIERLNKNI